MIKSVNHVLIYTFICFLCRSWSGVHRVSKGSVEAARFLLLGHPLFPHDPLPGPGHSGNMQHTQRMIPSPHCVCLQIRLLTQFPPTPPVRMRGEPGHGHHRPVPAAAPQAACQRAAGPGHSCCLLSAGAASHHSGEFKNATGK